MKIGAYLKKKLRFLEIPVKKRGTLSVLKNPDLKPIPRSQQTWGFWSNFAYWAVMSFQVGTWGSAASAAIYGLSYAATIGAFIIGNVLTMMFTLANSYPGWDWKVGYTMAQRFTFGIIGSWIGIIIRVLMSVVNYASNAWMGGQCLNMIIDSWSHHYLTLPNTLSSHVAMDTRGIIGFMLFHVVCALFYLIKPYHLNYVLILSCAGTCFSMVGMVIYLTKEAHGVGELFKNRESTATGSAYSWAWVYLISYWFGSVSPSAVNQSDYSRFASTQTALWLGTILALLIPAAIVPMFGVMGASTTSQLYGSPMWMPYDIFHYWLTTNYSAGGRAGAFFCGLSFTMSQMGFTASSAGFASGMDLAGLLPRYINIKRGAMICAIVSIACQPWNFYNSSSTFLTVMSSFGIVMTPIVSVTICDNLIIRRRNYSVSQAYLLRGEYYYNKGINWRALIAWICGMAPGLPGIAWEVNNNYFHNQGIVNFYYGDSFFSFLISFFLYWILCLIFPIKMKIVHDDKDYYDCFPDENARKKGMVPYSELSPEEISMHDITNKLDDYDQSSENAASEITVEVDNEKENRKQSKSSSGPERDEIIPKA